MLKLDMQKLGMIFYDTAGSHISGDTGITCIYIGLGKPIFVNPACLVKLVNPIISQISPNSCNIDIGCLGKPIIQADKMLWRKIVIGANIKSCIFNVKVGHIINAIIVTIANYIIRP